MSCTTSCPSSAPPSPGSGSSPTNNSSSLAAGQTEVDSEIAQMNAAFAFATKVNMEITTAKTIDGSEETAAQQRPNIG
jgi:hypothetical protein